MQTRNPRTDTPAQDGLERELREVEAAIAMVEEGGAPSVSLAGLSHAEAIVEALRESAAGRGVVLESIWGWEEDHSDLIARRAGSPTDG
ncbi:MAG TPA: hypothetical protein VK656_07845 [Candidatus Acidoferrum sp.]|jgi:hypothetical protein|nr:hypothetical protein [Candidatus Acidoferrum sp.]